MLSVVNFLNSIINFYEIIIFVWCILSWFPRGQGGVIDQLSGALDTIVRPYVGFFQKLIPPFGGIDVSPVVAIVVLDLIRRGIVYILL